MATGLVAGSSSVFTTVTTSPPSVFSFVLVGSSVFSLVPVGVVVGSVIGSVDGLSLGSGLGVVGSVDGLLVFELCSASATALTIAK